MTEKWKDVDYSELPLDTEILVSVTYNLDDREWETKMWVDEYSSHLGWRFYPSRIDIPFSPMQWMKLPLPPVFEDET